MIPYEDMLFKDWEFYWGQSTLFTKVDGAWVAVRPMCIDTDTGNRLCNPSDTLEEIAEDGGTLQFTVLNSDERITVTPLTPFESDDWITYEPELGYFLARGRLVLLTSSSPRTRHRGLHTSRLTMMPAADGSAMSTASANMIQPAHGSLPIVEISKQIVDRLNGGFPTVWGSTVLEAFTNCEPITVLDSNTALVLDQVKDIGHLLFQGTMLGTIKVKGSALVFTPRAPATSKLEVAVREWIEDKLTVIKGAA